MPPPVLAATDADAIEEDAEERYLEVEERGLGGRAKEAEEEPTRMAWVAAEGGDEEQAGSNNSSTKDEQEKSVAAYENSISKEKEGANEKEVESTKKEVVKWNQSQQIFLTKV